MVASFQLHTMANLVLRAFFWVISSYISAYENGTECSEKLAYKIQTPGNYPEESTQHSENGESLKSRII
jgi:hypothetical protein